MDGPQSKNMQKTKTLLCLWILFRNKVLTEEIFTKDNQINTCGPHVGSADNNDTKDIRNHSNDPNTNK